MTSDELVEILAEAMRHPVDGDTMHQFPPYRNYARRALTALHDRGLAVVPVEPTEAMLIAALNRALSWMAENKVTGLSPFTDYPSPTETTRKVYAAMLAARPSPKEGA